MFWTIAGAVCLGVVAGLAIYNNPKVLESIIKVATWLLKRFLIVGMPLGLLIFIGLKIRENRENVKNTLEIIGIFIVIMLALGAIVLGIYGIKHWIQKLKWNRYKKKGGKKDFEEWNNTREKSYSYVFRLLAGIPLLLIAFFLLGPLISGLIDRINSLL